MSRVIVRASYYRPRRRPAGAAGARRFDVEGGAARNWHDIAYTDRISRLVVEATETLLPEAELLDHDRTGIALGTVYGSQRLNEEMLAAIETAGPRKVSANDFAIDTYNSPAALAAIGRGLRGPSITLLTATGGLDAVDWACRQLLDGSATTMIAGGYDELTPFLAAALEAATPNIDVSRRWMFCESVALLRLETDAGTSGVPRAKAALGGFGMSARPDADGWETAMRMALDEAGIRLDDIDQLYRGAADPDGARTEADGIARVFGQSDKPEQFGPNSGHGLAGAPVEAAARAIAAIESGRKQAALVNASGLSAGCSVLVLRAT